MVRSKGRHAGTRKRIGVPRIILLLLPLCYLFVAGLHVADSRSKHADGSGSSVGLSKAVPLWVTNYEAPLDQWRWSTQKPTRFADRQISIRLWGWHHRRYQPRLLTPQYEHEHRYNMYQLHVVDRGGPPSLLEAIEREFGPDWNSDSHPENRDRVLRLIEDHVLDEIVRDVPETAVQLADDGSSHAVVSRFTTDGALSVRYRTIGAEQGVARDAVRPAFQLWALLSIGLFAFWIVSKDQRLARRWLAGECVKCRYPRLPDGAVCPECGLRYERPSHVTWDPKDGEVEP